MTDVTTETKLSEKLKVNEFQVMLSLKGLAWSIVDLISPGASSGPVLYKHDGPTGWIIRGSVSTPSKNGELLATNLYATVPYLYTIHFNKIANYVEFTFRPGQNLSPAQLADMMVCLEETIDSFGATMALLAIP